MKKSAFTLIELSIVLIIIGLLIGGSFKVLKVMRERAQVSRAQDDVKVAKEAIIGNAIVNNNTLPPIDFFDKNLSPIKSNQHQLFYADDPKLEKRDICSYSTTHLKVLPEGKATIHDIAFVVASESSNHNMQTAVKNNEVKIYKYSKIVDDNTSPINIKENYDDIVDWVTLRQLQAEAQCSEKRLRIVNTSLPSTDTTNSSSYKAKIVVDGNYSAITANDCIFALNGDTTQNDKFSYATNKNTFLITNSGSAIAGIVSVTCTISTDEKNTTKKFAITVNPVTNSSHNPSSNTPQ